MRTYGIMQVSGCFLSMFLAAIAIGVDAETAWSEPVLDLQFEDGRLSGLIDDAALNDVIASLNRTTNASGIEVSGVVYGHPDQILSDAFDEVPLENALLRLFQDVDHFLVFRSGSKAWTLQLLPPAEPRAVQVRRLNKTKVVKAPVAAPSVNRAVDDGSESDRLLADFRGTRDPQRLFRIVDQVLQQGDFSLQQTLLFLIQGLDPSLPKARLLEKISAEAPDPKIRKLATSMSQ